MPIPQPHSDESQGHYVSRCIQFLRREGKPGNQAAAICHTAWREHLQKNIQEELDAVRKQCEDFNEADARTPRTDEDT